MSWTSTVTCKGLVHPSGTYAQIALQTFMLCLACMYEHLEACHL